MRRLCYLFAPLCALLSVGAVSAETPADQVLLHGRIYTAEPGAPWAEAVAVRDGRIAAVGSDQAISGLIGETTTITDLNGGMVLPGLIDSHAHPIAGGRQMTFADLAGKPVTLQEFKAFVDASIASGKALQGDRIIIGGVPPGIWSEDLGAIFNAPPYAGRAILFAGADAHTGWASVAMLKWLGLDRATIEAMPPTERSYYHVDARGEPSGFAVEAGASHLFRGLPGRDGAYLRNWGVEAMRYYNAHGVTAVLEANAGHPSSDGEAILELYRDLAQSGDLTMRVSALLEAESEADLPQIYALRDKYAGLPNFKVIGVKIFADGVVDYPAQTAATLKPYLNSGKSGVLKITPDAMTRIVVDADRHDMLAHIHAIGDRAVEVALDAIAAARKADRASDLAHTLVHLHLVAPKDVPRFGTLAVIASFQLLWAALDQTERDLVKPYLASDVWDEQYPAYSIAATGGIVAGGSDWPVSTGNPWAAIAQAMTREGPYGVLGAKERMTIDQMLRAYTINAARALRRDQEIGSIRPGKEADLILIDRDVTRLPPKEVAATRVLWTMLHGQIVWRAGQSRAATPPVP